MKKLQEKLKLPSLVALSKFDQQIVFNLDKEDECLFMIDCLNGADRAQLQEYYLPNTDTLRTSDGKPLVNQFAASIYCNHVVYPGNEFSDTAAPANKTKADYILGTKWLYLKLYCSPAIANEILTKKILSLLHHLSKPVLKSWFFIRYRDPGYHIRLRLNLTETAIGPVLLQFKKRLAESVHCHLIREYQADTYRQEMERYGADMILLIEDFFHSSSELILRYIRLAAQKSFRYSYHSLAFVSVNLLTSNFIPDITERIAFLDQMVNLFYAEFATDKSLKIDLDQKYRELKKEIASLVGNAHYFDKVKLGPWAALFSDRIREVIKRAGGFSTKRRNQLLADMIHMHLNRLFTDSQRNQELIVYYCLLKNQVAIQAMNKKQV